jgi:hypothetical protein
MKIIQGIRFAFLFQLTATFTPQARGNCRLFLDTADLKEWDSLLKLGIFSGVTTNPSLLERCTQPCTVKNLNKLAGIALSMTEEFMCQAWGSTADEIYENGLLLNRSTGQGPHHHQSACYHGRCRICQPPGSIWSKGVDDRKLRLEASLGSECSRSQLHCSTSEKK